MLSPLFNINKHFASFVMGGWGCRPQISAFGARANDCSPSAGRRSLPRLGCDLRYARSWATGLRPVRFVEQHFFDIVFAKKRFYINFALQLVVVAQLVRASDCGSEGRGFEPHHPPRKLR